jgi:hypothetical protein
MQLPFSAEQFFGVFRAYNASVWPVQWLLAALALAAFAAAFVSNPRAGRAVSAILALLGLWTGVAYHFVFFAPINPLAYAFGAIAIGGALAFAWHGVVRERLVFRIRRDARSAFGVLLIGYALVAYPLWSIAIGHRYPELPTFGLPCPTTLLTIGMLGFLQPPYPRGVLVAPLAWSLIGAQAAFLLGVTPDLALLVAAAAAVVFIVRNGSPHDRFDRSGIPGHR